MSEEGRDEEGKFASGNRFWEKALNAFGQRGAMPKFTSPEELIEAAIGYFEDITDNPLLEEKAWQSDGSVVTHDTAKMRAMTIKGLCNWIGISERTWRDMRATRDDLVDTIEFLEQIIYQQKFEGAASGMLQHNIIARELGLAEAKELSGPGGAPIPVDVAELNPKERARRVAWILAKAQHEAAEENEDGDSETSQPTE